MEVAPLKTKLLVGPLHVVQQKYCCCQFLCGGFYPEDDDAIAATDDGKKSAATLKDLFYQIESHLNASEGEEVPNSFKDSCFVKVMKPSLHLKDHQPI